MKRLFLLVLSVGFVVASCESAHDRAVRGSGNGYVWFPFAVLSTFSEVVVAVAALFSGLYLGARASRAWRQRTGPQS